MAATSEADYVVLETSMGSITLELYRKHAPRTCKNFVELAKQGYYNGVIFHRIIRDFMIQGGDPTGTGRGGHSIYGSTFEDEISSQLKHTGAGVLSMLAPTPWLDGKHTIFGRVFSGMRIVQRMGMVPTDAADKPTEAVKILRATVVPPPS